MSQQQPEPIEMKPIGSSKDTTANDMNLHQHSIIEKQVIVNYKDQIRFVVGSLKCLAALSICLSSIVLGINVGAMCMQSVHLSAIRTLVEQLRSSGVHKHFKNKLHELIVLNADFMDEWHILFLVSCAASLVLAICAIFCLDLKKIHRIICYSVSSIILLLIEIILIVTAFLESNKFQAHNQSIINAFYKHDHSTKDTDLFTSVAGKILYSSQLQMMIIVCLFIACSILKFVSIPITFSLIISPHDYKNKNTASSRGRKSSPSLSDIIFNVLSINQAHYRSITAASNRVSRPNNASLRGSNLYPKQRDADNQQLQQKEKVSNENARGPRLSEIHFPKPPPRTHAAPPLQQIASQRVLDSDQNDHDQVRVKPIPLADIVSLVDIPAKRSFTSSMVEGHGHTKRRNTVSDFSVQRYPSLPSETTNQRSSDSEMLYAPHRNKRRSEGAFCSTMPTPGDQNDGNYNDDEHEEKEEDQEEEEEEKEEYSPLKGKKTNKVQTMARLLEKDLKSKENVAVNKPDAV